MDWQMENSKDMQLLDLGCLASLETVAAAADADLAGKVEIHNARRVRAAERLRRLVAERQRLGDFDAWQHADGADIAAARSRVRRESWDAILELRRVLEERQVILEQMEARLAARYEGLEQAHGAAVAAAERRLVKERRRLERANFATAGSHFADLVASEPPVAEVAEELASTRRALESVSTARRAVEADLGRIAARQREVFARMLGW